MALDITSVLSDVRQKIAGIEAELVKLKAVESYLGQLVPPPSTASAWSIPVPSLPNIGFVGRLANARQIDAIEAVLAGSNQPMRAADIVSEMLADGFPSADPSKLRNSVFTTMTRAEKKFEKAGPGLWRLRNKEP